jgi:3-oxoacyl-(acyl-carrier-protein) synthase III
VTVVGTKNINHKGIMNIKTDSNVGARIVSTGSYRPKNNVDNSRYDAMGFSDEWIQKRTGIKSRGIADVDGGETLAFMSAEAAKKAMANLNVSIHDIGMIIFSTTTYPHATPSGASEIASILGGKNIATMDLNSACAGFCYSLEIASSLIKNGTTDNIIVIGAETLQVNNNHNSPDVEFIFADGAGAVIVQKCEKEENGIGPAILGGDIENRGALILDTSWIDMRPQMLDKDENGNPIPKWPAMKMEGEKVFMFAVTTVADAMSSVLEKTGITINDIDVFIPHQANDRITQALTRRLSIPENVIVSHDIEHTGNTSSGSVPLALDSLILGGSVKSGDIALIGGFGAGLSYATQVIKLP